MPGREITFQTWKISPETFSFQVVGNIFCFPEIHHQPQARLILKRLATTTSSLYPIISFLQVQHKRLHLQKPQHHLAARRSAELGVQTYLHSISNLDKF